MRIDNEKLKLANSSSNNASYVKKIKELEKKLEERDRRSDSSIADESIKSKQISNLVDEVQMYKKELGTEREKFHSKQKNYEKKIQ